MISARTKAALAAAKAGGVRLGNPYLTPGDTKGARRARTKIADDFAADVMPYITRAREAGCRSLGELAAALEARASPPPAAAATGPAPVCNGSSIEPGKSYVALRCTRPRLEAPSPTDRCPHNVRTGTSSSLPPAGGARPASAASSPISSATPTTSRVATTS
jgi:hypothetical protein